MKYTTLEGCSQVTFLLHSLLHGRHFHLRALTQAPSSPPLPSTRADRKHWDHIESGHETRDVLENGIRRAHMEARLGRIATRYHPSPTRRCTLPLTLTKRPFWGVYGSTAPIGCSG
jgi:hypothetical protein